MRRVTPVEVIPILDTSLIYGQIFNSFHFPAAVPVISICSEDSVMKVSNASYRVLKIHNIHVTPPQYLLIILLGGYLAN